MLKLSQVQQSFYAHFFESTEKKIQGIKSSCAEERLAIYKGTIIGGLEKALTLIFPETVKLIGTKTFHHAAQEFCKYQDNLPSTGCLDDWGEAFPSFLQHQQALKKAPYVKDYAIFEWYHHDSNRAASAQPLSSEKISTLSEDALNNTIFTFMPSVRFFKSDYPIQKVQELIHTPDADGFTLTYEPCYALLTRPDYDVKCIWVDHILWEFCLMLSQQKTFLTTVTDITEKYTSFNLTQSLHFLLHHNLLTDKLNFEEN